MSLADDTEVLAQDYVMGLLGPADEAEADRRMQTDDAFAAAVGAWRARLTDFDASAPNAPPSPALWKRIEETTKKETVTALPGARNAVRGATVWEDIRFWRVTGLAGTFAAMVFAIIAFGALTTSKELRRDLITLAQSKPVYVAVLVNDTTKEAGAVVNAFANGHIELIPLKAIDVPAGRTLQVWTLWDRSIGPKSLGLSPTSRTLDLDVDQLPETRPDQLFEITLEPEGGSPIGRPTGPVLFKGNAARAL